MCNDSTRLANALDALEDIADANARLQNLVDIRGEGIRADILKALGDLDWAVRGAISGLAADRGPGVQGRTPSGGDTASRD